MKARRRSDCPACRSTISPGQTITKAGRYWTCCAGDDGGELTYKQRYGRCEDAPCCGCCGNSGYTSYDLYRRLGDD